MCSALREILLLCSHLINAVDQHPYLLLSPLQAFSCNPYINMRITMYIGASEDQVAFKQKLTDIADELQGICPMGPVATR